MLERFIVFTDVDDTLTLHGKLPSASLIALEKLSANGIKVIPVTGACAGWCDQICRLWPVTGVIGENGAFYVENKNDILIYNDTQFDDVRQINKEKIQLVAREIINKFPDLKPAMDNIYRRYDYAIDYNQQVKGISKETINSVVEICREQGISSSVSSIHINIWIGEFNKLLAIKNWLANHTNFTANEIKEKCFYIGDSPNDEIVFSYLENTVGVANIKKHLKYMQHKPKYITKQEGGLGFAEWVNDILDS